MSVPVIVLQIEPCEDGKVLYQRLAPLQDGEPERAMVYFSLRAWNQTNAKVTARGIVISFPNSGFAPIQISSRDVEIGPGGSAEIGLRGGEEFVLPAYVPPTIQLTVTFDGLTKPVQQSWPLFPHSRTWSFFAKPETDPKYGEFLTLPGNHLGGGGSQHFAYDVHVLGINPQGNLAETRTGKANDNTDYFLWGRPVYAMEDGIVVRAIDDNPDNPSPNERAFTRKAGSWQGTSQIAAVAVANLSPAANDQLDVLRMFVAVISGENLSVMALQQNWDASQLTYLSGAPGPAAQSGVSVAGISQTRAVTAHGNGADVYLVLWSIASNGSSISLLDQLQLPGLTNAQVVKLSSNRVAVLARTTGGKLSLAVHEWSNSGQFANGSIGATTGGSISNFDFVRLTDTRLAAAVQTLNDGLKLIVWDLGIGGDSGGLSTGSVTLTRVGEAEGLGSISELALAAKNETRIVTAVRTSEENIKLIAWDVLESGAIIRRGDVTNEDGQNVDLSYFKSSAYALGYRTAEGKLRLVAWEAEQNEKTLNVTFNKLFQRDTDGTTNLFAMGRIPTEQPTLITALRTQTGVLKLIPWQFTYGNVVSILHGNEMIHFVHLQQGSVPNYLLTAGTPVSKGQLVGRMGHSGKSENPHLHVHSERVRDELLADIDQLIHDVGIGTDVGVLRPLHFRDVRAVRAKNLVPGWENNPMSLIDSHGTYFESYAIWPAPGHAQQVTAPGKTIKS